MVPSRPFFIGRPGWVRSSTHGSGPTSKDIVDVGGFLGIGAKPVALAVNEMNFMRDKDGTCMLRPP